MLNDAQKKTISNIFRDLTKLTVIALVVGQFVPGNTFNFLVFMVGITISIAMGIVAVRYSVDIKEGKLK